MKRFLAILVLLFPSSAFAQMDELTYLTEMTALAKAVALEEECQIAIDADAMMKFVTSHFEGRESEVLSQLDGHVMAAKFTLNEASDLQKKLLCATAAQYVAKNNLTPAN